MNNETFISNEELVEMIKQKNDVAFTQLSERFDKFIYFKCRCVDPKYYGLDIEDIVQECKIVLYKAALAYNPKLGVMFSTYFQSALILAIKRMLKKMYKKKEMWHKETSIEYTSQFASTNIEEMPEGYILKKESFNWVLQEIGGCLTSLEQSCLLLYIEGLSYNEIAKRLCTLPKTVDNALHRAKRKLAKFIDIDDWFE